MTVAPSATYVLNTVSSTANPLHPVADNLGLAIHTQTNTPMINKSQAEYLQP